MIVPEYWAEAKLGGNIGKRRFTVRRFGWSDESVNAAQQHADQRVREAFDRVIAGETLPLREPKVSYNGAQGVPIREQVLAKHGEVVITRNAYGARCLNTPDVLFADIDFDELSHAGLAVRIGLPFIAGLVMLAWLQHWRAPIFLVLILIGSVMAAAIAKFVRRIQDRLGGGPEARARRRIDDFIATHPDWHVRLYRTPLGFRLLALHRRFDPNDPATIESLTALGTDPVYLLMCQRQHCFRARLGPKPWRIGIGHHMGPRPGVWPIRPERMAQRQDWVDEYERVAAGFAACHFVAELGSSNLDPAADAVRILHDELSQALSSLPAG